jgi:hypothetical protein
MEIHMHNPRPWRHKIPLLLAILAAAPALAQTSPAPTASASNSTAPPPASAPSADDSTPVAAAKTLLTALHEGNAAAARDALIIPEDHKAAIDAFLDATAAAARLQRAASARFHSAADALFTTPTPADLAATLQRVASGKLTVTGDTATLIVAVDAAAPPTIQTLVLKKIDAAWKIDGPAFFNLTSEPADKNSERAALARKLAAAADAVAVDIAAGKFFSAADAYQEYWSLCLQTTTAPATAATAAATAPAKP